MDVTFNDFNSWDEPNLEEEASENPKFDLGFDEEIALFTPLDSLDHSFGEGSAMEHIELESLKELSPLARKIKELFVSSIL